MPAQMAGTAGPTMPVAQHEKRHIAVGRPQAQPAAGGKVEKLWLAPDIGDHGGNGPAGDNLLRRPEQFRHVGGPHDDQMRRIKSCPGKARAIGQAQLLGILAQLQVKDRRATRGQQSPGLRHGKAQAGAGIAQLVGKHFLHQSPAQLGEHVALSGLGTARSIGQRRLALYIGNDFPERGKALVLVRGVHDNR